MQNGETIHYTDNGFVPSTVTIKVGQTVKFVNDTNEKMWVASDPHPSHTGYAGFDEDRGAAKGESYQFTFSKAGTWGFHNHLSSGDKGKVVVQ